MANINDYILWRGDLPLSKEFPFNEIDSMILARFSYLIFSKIEMKKKETIGSISKKMKDFPNEDFLYNGDKEMITYLGDSIRFKNMKVTNFVENVEKESEKQFGAIVIHPNLEELYVSYIGTDFSFNGWKEDFNMAFMDNVPCQIDGKKYLEEIANEYPLKKIRIGGHSKGGNVAIYSAITVSKKIQKRIIKVYNYDGPGFNKKIIDKYGNQDIINKIETYFPQESVIGRLLNHEEKCSISLSTEKGILQHDIFSWEVLGTDLIYSSKLTNASEIMNKTVENWLDNTTNEQRKMFVDTVFELLYSTEVTTFGELSKNWTKALPIVIQKYGELSKEDRKKLTEVVTAFLKSGFAEIKNNQSKVHTKNNQ